MKNTQNIGNNVLCSGQLNLRPPQTRNAVAEYMVSYLFIFNVPQARKRRDISRESNMFLSLETFLLPGKEFLFPQQSFLV